MSWSRAEVQLLIDLYKMYPCLYAVSQNDYKNKHARNKALSEICTEIAKVRPGTQISAIKNKFNNIRTNFLVQYRKYSSAFHSGMGEDETYKPNVWYFDTMMFIVDHTTPRKARDSILSPRSLSPEHSQDIEEEFQLSQEDSNDLEPSEEESFVGSAISNGAQGKNRVKVHGIDYISPTPGTSKSPTIAANNSAVKPKSKKKRKLEEDEIIATATSSLRQIQKALVDNPNSTRSLETTINQTQSEVFGNFVTKQLSCIEDDEELYLDVQHEISQVLYMARKKYFKNQTYEIELSDIGQ